MTLRIRLHNPRRLWTAFAAAGTPEWPPAPWRVLATLVAGAHGLAAEERTQARQVLNRLAESSPPEMWLPEALEQPLPPVWVPASIVDESEKNLQRLIDAPLAVSGLDDHRSKKVTPQRRLEWAHSCVWLDVDLSPSSQEIAVLVRAARQVGYVGRASHPIDVGLLTRDERGWVDHSGRSSGSDQQMMEPSIHHTRWVPVTREGTPVRCWTEGALQILDADYEQRMLRGQRGLGDEAKGRTVLYAPRGSGNGAFRWIEMRLARSTTDVAGVVAAVAAVRPVKSEREVPVLHRSRLLGLLVDGPAASSETQQALPGWFTAGSLPRKRDYVGSGSTWHTATPVAAVANERAARAVIARDLSNYAGTQHLQLDYAGPCETRAELGLWHCRWQAAAGVTGPVRAGFEQDKGSGVFVLGKQDPAPTEREVMR